MALQALPDDLRRHILRQLLLHGSLETIARSLVQLKRSCHTFRRILHNSDGPGDERAVLAMMNHLSQSPDPISRRLVRSSITAAITKGKGGEYMNALWELGERVRLFAIITQWDGADVQGRRRAPRLRRAGLSPLGQHQFVRLAALKAELIMVTGDLCTLSAVAVRCKAELIELVGAEQYRVACAEVQSPTPLPPPAMPVMPAVPIDLEEN